MQLFAGIFKMGVVSVSLFFFTDYLYECNTDFYCFTDICLTGPTRYLTCGLLIKLLGKIAMTQATSQTKPSTLKHQTFSTC